MCRRHVLGWCSPFFVALTDSARPPVTSGGCAGQNAGQARLPGAERMATRHETDLPDTIDAAVLKVAGVVVLGAIMSILDITVVNVALPTFETVFSSPGNTVSYAHVAWTVTAYTLALATVIPLS